MKDYVQTLRDRADSDKEFTIEILDLLHFIGKFRKDVVTEMITEAAIELFENQAQIEDLNSKDQIMEREIELKFQETKDDQIEQEDYKPFELKSREENFQKELQIASKKGITAEDQMKELMKFRIAKPEEKKLVYSSSEEEGDEASEEQ